MSGPPLSQGSGVGGEREAVLGWRGLGTTPQLEPVPLQPHLCQSCNSFTSTVLCDRSDFCPFFGYLLLQQPSPDQTHPRRACSTMGSRTVQCGRASSCNVISLTHFLVPSREEASQIQVCRRTVRRLPLSNPWVTPLNLPPTTPLLLGILAPSPR